jgi:hypothetical protein
VSRAKGEIGKNLREPRFISVSDAYRSLGAGYPQTSKSKGDLPCPSPFMFPIFSLDLINAQHQQLDLGACGLWHDDGRPDSMSQGQG